MSKVTQTINNVTFTSVTLTDSRILSITLNHKSNRLTVAYANEVEVVDPADDWVWWDHLVAKYIA